MRAGRPAAFFGGALTLLSAVAHAGSAPKELYGKSISVAWSEARTQRFQSDQVAINTGAANEMSVYISAAGRPFVRVNQTGIGGRNPHGSAGGLNGSMSEVAPTGSPSAEKDRVDFEGHSIVVYRELQSGVRRIVIDFDGTSTSCKATVIYGRERGKNILRYTNGRGSAEVFSTQVGTVNCSIREGNVFGQ
jgi:hypothetical protein